GSSQIRARLFVPCGGSDHCKGGETSSPSPVYCFGMSAPSSKAALVNWILIVAPLGCPLFAPCLHPGPRQRTNRQISDLLATQERVSAWGRTPTSWGVFVGGFVVDMATSALAVSAQRLPVILLPARRPACSRISNLSPARQRPPCRLRYALSIAA